MCRSKLLAGGSTPPRQRCNLAGLQAGRLQLPQEPEGLLDLEGKTTGNIGQFLRAFRALLCHYHYAISPEQQSFQFKIT